MDQEAGDLNQKSYDPSVIQPSSDPNGTQAGPSQMPVAVEVQNQFGNGANDNDGNEVANNAKGGNEGKVYSEWWAHYEKLEVNKVKKAKCKYCKRLMVGDPKQGTSHLKKHYERCPKRKVPVDIRQQLLQANSNKEKFQLSPFNFDKQNSRKELAKAIIKHEYSLSIVDHEGFRSFVASLNPLFKMVCRNTIKKDCLTIYDLERDAMMQLLDKNEGRVALTTDMWTSTSQKKGFMVVTAHYVDNNWKLQSRILRFIYLPAPHTSDVLAEALWDCMTQWNVDSRLSAITVDNCSTNDAMMSQLLEKLPFESLQLGGY
ncbi:unnamed protein product [Linum trigynum]|uniref:BED-type domain-containing protein n=1 Tax=Linum trigynum TaxID=586398 RepID=A0AAV2GA36_9ROSI